jgi:hypothetical protein
MRLTDLSFEEWIEHAFSREVRFQQAVWYSDPNQDWWDPKPGEAVAYLTRLFEDPAQSLYWFSDDQNAQGLTYLVGTSASGDNGLRHGRPGRGSRSMRRGDRQTLRSTVRSTLHTASRRTLVRSRRARLTAFVICGGTNFHASHFRATRTCNG